MSGDTEPRYEAFDQIFIDQNTDFYELEAENIQNAVRTELSKDEDLIIEASREGSCDKWRIYRYEPDFADKMRSLVKTGETNPLLFEINMKFEFGDYVGGGCYEYNHIGLVKDRDLEQVVESLEDNNYKIEDHIEPGKSVITEQSK